MQRHGAIDSACAAARACPAIARLHAIVIAATTTTSIGTISESRDHNPVNKVVERDSAGSSSDHTLDFDNAGNLATVRRLAQEFNGLNWLTGRSDPPRSMMPRGTARLPRISRDPFSPQF